MNFSHSNAIAILNQIHNLKLKLVKNSELESYERFFHRIFFHFESLGVLYYDPLGEEYDIERVDCDGTIVKSERNCLKIIEVIKPIIFSLEDSERKLLQKGIVLVG